jgi:hypothetical protein
VLVRLSPTEPDMEGRNPEARQAKTLLSTPAGLLYVTYFGACNGGSLTRAAV